tara:strand:+ start:557 stop:1147 length:591 start_codon:yes stop_codon:yes gene_type:complete
MANYEATKYDFDAANLTGIEGVNTGLIVPWSIAALPTGFLECDGAAISRTTYSTLFAVVSTTYGVGDGASTFNVPNLTDSVVLGRSPSKALAATGGANTFTSTASIGGSVGNTTLATPEIPAHSHPSPGNTSVTFGRNGAGGMASSCATGAPSNPASSQATGGGGAHTHPTGGLTFAGAATSILQPYLTIKYVIKT